MTFATSARDGADRCPGLITPFVSADGAMVRLRLPGGRVEGLMLLEVASLATRFADPKITLTSRGSLQLRGLPDPLPDELVGAIDALGLIPSGAHDKARNIIADPDAGLDDLISALDAGVLADPELAGLPGRFLFAVAGADGPVLAEPWDIAIVDDVSTVRVAMDGRSVVVPREQAASAALDVARRFLAARTDERTWNVRDLPVEARTELLPDGTPFVMDPAQPPAPGPVGDDLFVVVPLGLLTIEQADALAGLRGSLRITPWRSVLVPGGAAHADRFAETGLVTSPSSPWTVLTACAGAPACARTDTPTRDLAREAAPFVDVTGPPVHVIGCERACGHPAREHTTALNPTSVADIVAAQRSARHEKDS